MSFLENTYDCTLEPQFSIRIPAGDVGSSLVEQIRGESFHINGETAEVIASVRNLDGPMVVTPVLLTFKTKVIPPDGHDLHPDVLKEFAAERGLVECPALTAPFLRLAWQKTPTKNMVAVMSAPLAVEGHCDIRLAIENCVTFGESIRLMVTPHRSPGIFSLIFSFVYCRIER